MNDAVVEPNPTQPWWRRRTVVIAGSAGLVVLLLVAGLIVWAANRDSSTKQQFREAVSALESAPAIRYRTTLLAGTGAEITTTRGGATLGSISLLGQQIGVLRVGDKTYIKTPALGPLTGSQPNPETAAVLADRWITGTPLSGPLLPGGYPTPAEVGGRLSAAVEQTERFPDSDETVPVDSLTAWKASTPAGDLWVSTAKPHRVVRLVPPGGGAGPSVPNLPSLPSLPSLPPIPARSLRPLPSLPTPVGGVGNVLRAPPPETRALAASQVGTGQLDFQPMSPADVNKTYGDLVTESRKLTTAIDQSYQFQLQGSAAFVGCGPASCTVMQTATSSFTSATVKAPPTINAEMTVTMTGGGAPVGGCTATGTLPVNGTGQLSCTNVSPAWAAFYLRATQTRGTHPYTARVVLVARAMTEALVDELIKKLLAEQEEYQRNQSPSKAPAPSPSGGKCDQVNRQAELGRAEAAAEQVSLAYSRPEFRTQNQTVAVLVVCVISSGQLRSYVAGRPELQDAQRSTAVGLGLVIALNPGNALHAEPAAINRTKADAKADPVNPVAIYATNPFCRDDPDCKTMLENEPGSQVQTPAPPRREARASLFSPGIVWS